ncbi:hypothetical protein HK105_207575 [Polyrhizophydium stewartii]|uniref:Ankyrin repeat protein n=1 Tax=Polyrhizophydium stewartii TaxID=2732419 RepID=A0ABR4N090_9FUNG
MDTPHIALAAALGQLDPAALQSVAAMLARLTAAVGAQPKDSDVLGRIASLEDSHRRTQDRATQLAARVAALQAAVERLEADNKRLCAEVAALRQPPSAAAPPAGRTDPPAPYRRTNGFRPDATNEWDRMPAEIQNKILDAAGPFTKFVNGLLLKAELLALSDKQREQVWQDANDVDWQGDVKSLPFVDIASRSLNITTRSFFMRIPNSKSKMQVALRNGWTDLLDFSKPEHLAFAGIAEGVFWLLEDLIDVRKIVDPERSFTLSTCDPFDVAMLEFLDQRMPAEQWNSKFGVKAAERGKLDLIVWLHTHHPACIDHDAYDSAASNGHMHIVRWLADNTDIECGGSAFESAARNDRFEMLKFLHSRFPEVLVEQKPLNGYVSSNIAIIQWLDEHDAMDPYVVAGHLFSTGSLDVLEWLMARFDVELDDWHFKRGHVGRQTKMLKQMHERGHELTLEAAKIATWQCNTDIMQWAIQRDRSVIPMLVEATATETLANATLVEWWRVRHGVVFGQRELEMAIRSCNDRLVKHMLEMDGADWDLEAARAALDQAVADSDDGAYQHFHLDIRRSIDEAVRRL